MELQYTFIDMEDRGEQLYTSQICMPRIGLVHWRTGRIAYRNYWKHILNKITWSMEDNKMVQLPQAFERKTASLRTLVAQQGKKYR